MYQPDNWVILKVQPDEYTAPFYRVLAGWSGGYLDGDSWRLNSGIDEIKEDGDYYLFIGASGSTYKCHKNAETVRMNIAPTLSSILDAHPDAVTHITYDQMIKEMACE